MVEMFVVPAKLKLTLPNLNAPYIAGTNLACHTISHHAASHRNVPKLACLTKTCQTPTQHNGPPHTLPAVTYLDAPRLANPVQDIPQLPCHNRPEQNSLRRTPTNPNCHTLPYMALPELNIINHAVANPNCLAKSHLTAAKLAAPELGTPQLACHS